MKLTRRQKKWIAILIVLVLIRYVIEGIFFYVITYRVKDLVQIAVRKETKGQYAFDAASIQFSIRKKTLIVEDAQLYCRDSANLPAYYKITIPRMYLALHSWKELLFKKKASVDSLIIIEPEIFTRSKAENQAEEKHISFQFSKLLEYIRKLVAHLQVKTLDVRNAAFTYSNTKSQSPFVSNKINFSIRGFSNSSDSLNRLLSSEDIDLSIENQHWILPDGVHDISFSRLHFSGKSQLFELDSCIIHSAPINEKGEITLAADKFYFNSHHLASLYEKEELLIDTALCIRPILNLQSHSNTKNNADSAAQVSAAIGHLFRNVNIKYIQVIDGELLLGARSSGHSSYHTAKTNLRVYNLYLNPDSSHQISTDSIQLNLANIEFYTPDSLFKLRIEDFALSNNDVIFRNAKFEPTSSNHPDKGMIFTTPSLRLYNISLADLLRKKLIAKKAELIDPQITVYNKSRTAPRARVDPAKIGHFFQALHGLHELLAVEHFDILNGTVSFHTNVPKTIEVKMKGLNASILLDRMLTSDSLIDIKRSLPAFSVGQIEVLSPQVILQIADYHLDGSNRHNIAGKFYVHFSNGTSINGEKLYWEILDWDLYEKFKIVQVQYLNFGALDVSLPPERQNVQQVQKKELPIVHIGRIDVDRLHLHRVGPKSALNVEGQEICVDSINTTKQFFTWINAQGIFKKLDFNNGKLHASVGDLKFDNTYKTSLQQVHIDSKNAGSSAAISIPLVVIRSSITSTDFRKLNLLSMSVDQPMVEIRSRGGKSSGETDLKIPLNARLEKLSISHGTIGLKKQMPDGDSLVASAGLNLRADTIELSKEKPEFISYQNFHIDLSGVHFTKKGLQSDAVQLSVKGTGGIMRKEKGQPVGFTSGISAAWSDLHFAVAQNGKFQININHISGSYENADLSTDRKVALKWQTLANQFSIREGDIFIKTKKTIFSAKDISWNPREARLKVKGFRLNPALSLEETFKEGNWQTDYINAEGGLVDIHGLKLNEGYADSSLTAGKIEMNQISITTLRDKRMPFHHGIEKFMPTKLINTIKYPFRIDSIVVAGSNVTVNEISIITRQKGTIPLQNISATITHVGNISNAKDSLNIVATAELFDNSIRHFHYIESYGDSLSFYYAHIRTSKMHLPNFSQATVPLAAVNIEDGLSDTLYAQWTGNKYAAIGLMNFYYKDLRVRLLDQQDSSNKRFVLTLENLVANKIIIRKNNAKPSSIFFERDREKFIFNYWVKSALKGMLSSVGLKNSRKHKKQYEKLRKKYKLPDYHD